MTELAQYLARKAGKLAERRADFETLPGSSVITVRASSKVAGGTGARLTRVGETLLVTDAAPGIGGYGLGPSAPELLLGALASCLVHTYLIQAALNAFALTHVEVEISGELDMAGVVGLPFDQAPAVQNLRYRAEVQGIADTAQLERLHALVEATCPVLNSLRQPVSVERIE